MADELDQDSQVLLDGLGLGAPSPDQQQQEDEIVVPARTDDDAGGLGGGGDASRATAPQGEYVSKSDYEALRRDLDAQRAQFDALQQQIGQRAAQQFQPQPQQPYYPPSQYGQPADVQQQLNDAILANPAAVIPQLVQMAIQRQGQPLVQAQQQTEVTVAQQVISNLRNSFASQDPDLSKLALPEVDAIVAATRPELLAQYLREGSLQTHYENAYHQAVGKKMRPVYATAAQRRAQSRAVAEPPAIGGGSVTSLSGKRQSGEVRMSDLDEATRIAIEEGKKYGVSAETILKMDA